MDLKDFLMVLEDKSGKQIDGDVDEKVLKAIKEYGIKDSDYKWIFKPKDYDLVVMERPNDKWTILFLMEVYKDYKDDDEDIFKEDYTPSFEKIILEKEIGYKVVDEVTGDFPYIVTICIEVVTNKSSYKGGFNKANISSLLKV